MTTAIGLAIMQWQDATQAYDEAVGTRLQQLAESVIAAAWPRRRDGDPHPPVR